MTKDFSMTIQGLVLLALLTLVRGLELDLDEGQVTEISIWVASGIAGLMVWVGRVRKGDITWYGKRK